MSWQLRAVADTNTGILRRLFPVRFGRQLDDVDRRAVQRAAERLEADGKIVRLRLGYDGARLIYL
jgi:hypothetical protein